MDFVVRINVPVGPITLLLVPLSIIFTTLLLVVVQMSVWIFMVKKQLTQICTRAVRAVFGARSPRRRLSDIYKQLNTPMQ